MSAAPKLGFGYLYDFRNPAPWRQDWHALYEETLETIAWSETAGFYGAWLPEHHAAGDAYLPAPNLIMAAIAARTQKIRFGAAIALAPLYHPVRFAEECAVLDILSNGRLETALAIGYRRREYEMFGEDFSKRGARFDEFLEIATRLWRGETVDFAGKHYTVTQARIAPLPPRGKIPLYMGGFADKALARVAKYADGYFGNEEVCGVYLEKLKAQGKDPAAAAIRLQGLFLTVAEDPEQAMAELAPYYHYVNNSYSEWLGEDQAIGLDAPALKPMELEAFKTSGILKILTPAQAISYFKELRARMGVEHFMMMRPPGLKAARFQHYAQVFADKVAPAFA